MGGWRMRKRDIRTLCPSCLSEYREAGFRAYLIKSGEREYCDRCRVRMGWSYEIKWKRRERDSQK